MRSRPPRYRGKAIAAVTTGECGHRRRRIMKKSMKLSFVLCATTLLVAPISADIVVLNNGQAYVGKVSTGAGDRIKLTTQYGDQFFQRTELVGFYLTPEGMEAEGYYQAGVAVLSKGQQDTAVKLFQRAIAYDASYRDKCRLALRGSPSAVSPATTPDKGPVTGTAQQPQTQTVRIQCTECSGSGIIMSTSRLDEGSRERSRPCPLCGGRGFKDLTIPPGYEMCSDCGGFGSTSGGGSSGGSSKNAFTTRKTMCPRCNGRGFVKMPWRPESENTAVVAAPDPATVPSTSPEPGTAPPTGPAAIARDRANAVAQGEQPTRPIGPSGVRPVSPTLLEDPNGPTFEESPDFTTEEGTTEMEAEGSSGSGSDASSEEVKSDDSESGSSTYVQPGIAGWVGRHKWYIVLGGVVLLVFAVVFSKMGGKK
jgi:hypothetical protein